ncbi:hypothetical protein CF319_g6140 [Tilletia indica]|nr:hypothetical protein CF319_g6140 [Tilletia indica]
MSPVSSRRMRMSHSAKHPDGMFYRRHLSQWTAQALSTFPPEKMQMLVHQLNKLPIERIDYNEGSPHRWKKTAKWVKQMMESSNGKAILLTRLATQQRARRSSPDGEHGRPGGSSSADALR